MTLTNTLLQVRIKAIEYQAEGICTFELRPLPPLRMLVPFAAGSHVDLQLPNGMIRSYSLVNDPSETHRYVIGVNNDRNSRGGSRYLHERVRVGDVLTISSPRNNFSLDEAAPHSVFIAGGIGITPLLCMIRRLGHLQKSWELHYASRTRRAAAFLDELNDIGRAGPPLHLTFDAEPGGVMLDLQAVVSAAPAEAHLYCCGPVPMIEAFEKACEARPRHTYHVEYFSAKDAPDTAGGYEVELSRSGQTVAVPPGKTILDALLDLGISAPYSCQQGVCGTCEVRVLAGIPDHRDLVLSPEEQEANDVMMICCSGSKTPKIVLDL